MKNKKGREPMKICTSLREMRDKVSAIRFSKDGEILAGAAGKKIVLTSFNTGDELFTINCCAKVHDLSFSVDGLLVAACDNNGIITIWNISDGEEIRRLHQKHNKYITVAFSPDGKTLAAGTFEPWVHVFDLGTGKLLYQLDPNEFGEHRTCVVFTANGKRIATTAYNSVFIFTLPARSERSRKITRPIKYSTRYHSHVMDVAFSPCEKLVAGLADPGGSEGPFAVHIWDIKSRKKRRKMNLEAIGQRLCFTPDGSCIAVAEINGPGISLWNVNDGKRIKKQFSGAEQHDFTCLAINPSGGTLVAGTDSGTIMGWDLATGNEL